MKARVRTAALAGVAFASGAADAAEPVHEAGARAAALVSVFDGDGALESEPLTLRASVWGSAGLLFENQWEAGVGGALAVERDHPVRDPRGGRFGDCAPGFAGCADIAGAPVRGLVGGAFTAGPVADEGPRASLEAAYVYVRTGWGEASVGRDVGAGERFSLTPPTVLAIGGGLDPAVEATGHGAVILRNDVSGQSAKLALATTRILGLQAGVSWTPEAELEGLDQGYRARAGAPAVFEPEDVLEAGLSFAHTFPGGWETAAGVTWSRADDRGGRAAFGDMEGVSAGVTLGQGPWSGGLSWLVNDNGWAAGNRDYAAWGASGVYTAGDWALMLELGQSRDDLVDVDVGTVTFAGRRSLASGFSLAGGAAWREVEAPVSDGLSRTVRSVCGLGAFVEFSWTL